MAEDEGDFDGDFSPEPAADDFGGEVDGNLQGDGDIGGTSFLAQQLADNALLQAYTEASEAKELKPNHLVKRSLDESAQSDSGVFWIAAAGNNPQVFSSRLKDADMIIFAQVFTPLAQYLVHIDLSYNLLTDAGIESLVQGGLIGNASSSLRSLSLGGNDIGPMGCDALCQALRYCPALEVLDLSRNPLLRSGGLLVIGLLQETQSLSELYLADTQIDIDVLVAISAVLLTCIPKLRLLDIENPRIQTLQEEHTVHLGRMLRVNTSLQEVRMGKLKMRDEGVRQLVSFLLENKTLKVLDLRCNELGAAGAEHLAVLLATDCQLTHLNLSGNRIGERENVDGALALARALQNNRMLCYLDLDHNLMCGDALQCIGESLEKNSTLEAISLFNNQWSQPASYKFHQIFNDRARIVPLRADFITSQVDMRIDICKVQDFSPKV